MTSDFSAGSRSRVSSGVAWWHSANSSLGALRAGQGAALPASLSLFSSTSVLTVCACGGAEQVPSQLQARSVRLCWRCSTAQQRGGRLSAHSSSSRHGTAAAAGGCCGLLDVQDRGPPAAPGAPVPGGARHQAPGAPQHPLHESRSCALLGACPAWPGQGACAGVRRSQTPGVRGRKRTSACPACVITCLPHCAEPGQPDLAQGPAEGSMGRTSAQAACRPCAAVLDPRRPALCSWRTAFSVAGVPAQAKRSRAVSLLLHCCTLHAEEPDSPGRSAAHSCSASSQTPCAWSPLSLPEP